MSAFARSTFTNDRSLVYMSIDGKKSIFSDGTHIFLKFGPKNGEKSYSLEIIRLKSHIFDKNFWKVVALKSRKIMIFKFWFSTCRRKITWGFRIWPYFLHFVMQKWSKTWIYDEFSHFRVYRNKPKSRDKSLFLTTFAYKIRKSKVRFGILVQFYVDMY